MEELKLRQSIKNLDCNNLSKKFVQSHEKTCFLHICKNKDADQLHGNSTADQRLCFRFIDSTIPLLPKSDSVAQNLKWPYN